MKVNLFSMLWNEERILPYFINFYKERFSNIEFFITDNNSTDNTVQIAKELGCNVITDDFSQMSNTVLNEHRNNIWKLSTADWVIVCDADECLDITEQELDDNVTLYMGEGYDMIGDTIDYNELTEGVRNGLYDKTILFKPQEICEINYTVGGHTCSPEGNVIYADYRPKLYHMRYPNFGWVIERYRSYCDRRCDEDVKEKYGGQYGWTLETQREFWNEMLLKKIKVR